MLDEFAAMAGCHRKHAVRLLGLGERSTGRSVPKGRRIYDEAVRQALIDSDTPVPGVTSEALRPEIAVISVPSTTDGGNMAGDDFDVTAGWGHFGSGQAVMPGQGRVVERRYTSEDLAALGDAVSTLGDTTFDVYLNDRAYWRNVPASVWSYTSSGAIRCSRSGYRTGSAGCWGGDLGWMRSSTSRTQRGGKRPS